MLVALEEHSIKPKYPFVTASRVWDPEKGYNKQAAETTIEKAQAILSQLQELCGHNLGHTPES